MKDNYGTERDRRLGFYPPQKSVPPATLEAEIEAFVASQVTNPDLRTTVDYIMAWEARRQQDLEGQIRRLSVTLREEGYSEGDLEEIKNGDMVAKKYRV